MDGFQLVARTDEIPPGESKVVIVNETFVHRYLPNENPVGQILRVGQTDWQIAGICHDAKYTEVKLPAPPTVYFSFRQSSLGLANFAVRTSLPPMAVATAVRKAVGLIDPNVPVATITTQERVRDAGIARLVFASSSAVFGDDPALPKVEESIGRAVSPYGLTKHINELYAGVFATCYGFKWIGLRYFNVFGPRQDPFGPYASVIPAWIGALLRGKPAYINGDGSCARDFCHVDNVVQMNLRAAMTEDPAALNQAYNVAHGEMTSLTELFDIIRTLLGRRLPHLKGARPVHREPRRGDILLSRADIGRARRLLGYEPTVRIMDGLERTMDWYIAQLAPRDERKVANV